MGEKISEYNVKSITQANIQWPPFIMNAVKAENNEERGQKALIRKSPYQSP